MRRNISAGGLKIFVSTADEKNHARLFLSQENHQRRSVLFFVGSGTKDNPITVKVGETVLYGKYSGTELKFESKDYLIMRESDILAIV